MLHRRQPKDLAALNALAMQEMAPPQPITIWATIWYSPSIGGYEEERIDGLPTGWYRCLGGRLASYLWPEWHRHTGATRYSL